MNSLIYKIRVSIRPHLELWRKERVEGQICGDLENPRSGLIGPTPTLAALGSSA
jgi:hypothetical protein